MERWISLVGLAFMLGLAYLLSADRQRISARVVLGGIFLQWVFALLILRTDAGQTSFALAGGLVQQMLGCVDKGSEFVFGKEFRQHYFAFRVLPTIIFFSSLMTVLYHLGIMQLVVGGVAWVMRRTLKTTGAETLSAAGNIFLGQTEAPLLVAPYLSVMSQSELMAVMVGGFATIAGGVLAVFVSMNIDAAHLLSASVMSAPASLVIAKIMLPETGPNSDTRSLGEKRDSNAEVARHAGLLPTDTVNVIHAATHGAMEGAKLALNVAAQIIAFLAMIALCDGVLGWVGLQAREWVGDAWGQQFGKSWSLAGGLSYLFAPVAWVMGVDRADCFKIGELLGIKMVANEFLAYERLAEWIDPEKGRQISARSEIIATYALCAFANFASIGVQIGGLGSLAPERTRDLAKLGFKAMLGGTLASFMTACIAGILV